MKLSDQNYNLFDLLKYTHDEFQDYGKDLKFDKNNPVHLFQILLYGTISEITSSCILQLSNDLHTVIPILIRTMLEAYIDLINLSRDTNYRHTLQASTLKQGSKIKKNLKFDEEKKQLDNQLKELTMLNSPKLLIKEKFSHAGMNNLHDFTYMGLCLESHNNPISLAARHLSSPDDDSSVIFYKKKTSEEIKYYLLLILDIFISATEIISKKFISHKLQSVILQREKLNNFTGGSTLLKPDTSKEVEDITKPIK